jgi:hypothetical protein
LQFKHKCDKVKLKTDKTKVLKNKKENKMSEQSTLTGPQGAELFDKFDQARDLAKRADEAEGVTLSRRQSEAADARVRGGQVEYLGDSLSPNHVRVNAGGDRIDVKIKDEKDLPDGVRVRTVHAIDDHQHGLDQTIMTVRNPDGSKRELMSTNPQVHKMLADIAIEKARNEAQTAIDSSEQKAA